MTDKEILLDALENEKNMSTNMTYALNEASHEKLYNELFNMFEGINESAKELFAIAYELNYYELEAEKKTKIEKTAQKLNQELTKFYDEKNAE
ncbi:MAG: spore coat protein [Bacilli bacterium]|nr:spore coat protein [Bacilli bacterium]